jgi:hypothetical protein
LLFDAGGLDASLARQKRKGLKKTLDFALALAS